MGPGSAEQRLHAAPRPGHEDSSNLSASSQLLVSAAVDAARPGGSVLRAARREHSAAARPVPAAGWAVSVPAGFARSEPAANRGAVAGCFAAAILVAPPDCCAGC